MMKKKNVYIIVLCIALCVALSLQAGSQSLEYRVKALLIEKFARFTEWSAGGKGDTFVIAVLGRSPFNGELEAVARRTTIKNKPVRIVYIGDVREARDCQLLFVCESEKRGLSDIVKFVRSFNILTVSDAPGFCRQGVHLNFYVDDADEIKFEINPASLKQSSLTVDLQLLNYGKVIE